jgi:hypothetical protein
MLRTEADLLSTAQWWSGRRLRYNLSIAAAGLLSFILYAAIVWSFQDRLPEVEITAFTVVFQAVGFLIAMAIANICYFLGPMSERWLQPGRLGAYRRRAYGMGLGYSLLLIFSPPALVLYVARVGA